MIRNIHFDKYHEKKRINKYLLQKYMQNYQLKKNKNLTTSRNSTSKFNIQKNVSYQKLIQALTTQHNKIQSLLRKYHYFQQKQTQFNDRKNKINRQRAYSIASSIRNDSSVVNNIEPITSHRNINKKFSQDRQQTLVNQYNIVSDKRSTKKLPKLDPQQKKFIKTKIKKSRSKKKVKKIIRDNAYTQKLQINIKPIKTLKRRSKKLNIQNSVLTFLPKYNQLPQSPVEQLQQNKNISFDESQQNNPQNSININQYYEQFEQKIDKQLGEQLNYLMEYENKETKDWIEQMMRKFEEDDRNLVRFRNEAKYLKQFDETYFTYSFI